MHHKHDTSTLAIINGSRSGEKSNSFKIYRHGEKLFFDELKKRSLPKPKIRIIHLHDLAETKTIDYQKILQGIFSHAQGFLFLTGTYWDSWSSHLQRALEEMTFLECSPHIYGKPAGVLTTMHSVGGKEVATRLQGVLSTMGFLIPPQSGMSISLATEMASHPTEKKSKHIPVKDFWSIEDLTHLLFHVLDFAGMEKKISPPWPVDHGNPSKIWYTPLKKF